MGAHTALVTLYQLFEWEHVLIKMCVCIGIGVGVYCMMVSIVVQEEYAYNNIEIPSSEKRNIHHTSPNPCTNRYALIAYKCFAYWPR